MKLRQGQVHMFLSKILGLFNFAYNVIEQKILKNNYQSNYILPPVFFIVGPPRSGTTVSFQLISKYFHTYFPDNLAALFPRHPAFGFSLSRYLYKNRGHNSYSSEHGYSLSDLHGPNEYELFFKGFLSNNRRLSHLAKKITSIQSIMKDKPIVFKSLNCSLHISEISTVLPNSVFIFIDRNNIDIERSIEKAKRREKFPEEEVWYVVPDGMERLNFESEKEQIKRQVFEIKKSISNSLEALPDERKIKISYESLIESPACVLKTLENKFIELKMKKELSSPISKNKFLSF
ncbi:sulfotransferase [Pseudoalteromonas sp. MMG022]|uniref:sulfotransferase n=1 Tax=Pseudoalteromonas sp. MMG022 TaxID=2909978 RepID=UPI001F438557|nr:sulfotransferase [Pseudoalteromonas sp. MMG022]MCF6437776.1 sulfotransferase [Pseudoalteromonas sp. MMG022]